MKVLLLTRFYFPIDRPSGVISLVREIAKSLTRQGHEVAVACVRKEGENDYYQDDQGIKVFKYSQKDPLSLRRIARAFQVDRVIVCSSISSGAVLASWWIIFILGAGLRKKTIFYQTTNLSVNKFSSLVIRLAAKLSARYAATNHSILKLLNLEASEERVVLPAVEPLDYKYKGPRTFASPFTVCFMGHLTKVKGADRVLEVAKLLPDVKFRLIAGFSPGKENIAFYDLLVKQISAIPNVEHFPYCTNPIELLSASDLLILPYRDGKTVLGVAQSAVEAMAFGIPVFASDNNAIDELLCSGVNGLALNEVREYVDEIKRLSIDKTRYLSYSKRARETVTERFSIDKQALKLLT
jgi:glycosyltransferase involved in cell wall biosynthesis